MTIDNDIQADQSPCSLTDDDLQDLAGGLLMPPSSFPESDPGSPFPSWLLWL